MTVASAEQIAQAAAALPDPGVGLVTSEAQGTSSRRQRNRSHYSPNGQLEVAIIGMGAWGLAVLERLLTVIRQGGSGASAVLIHVVEPGSPGSGVYSVDLPGYLVMNTPCGQISLFPGDEAEASLPYQVGLFSWARRNGYTWHGDLCLPQPGGRAISENDFLPRSVVGRYLQWFYDALVSSPPSGVRIQLHRAAAVEVVAAGADQEVVTLSSGARLTVDHVMLTSGHTPNLLPEPGWGAALDPYSVVREQVAVDPGSLVAIAGMGLVATDVLAALTRGRGGRFEVGSGDRLRYLPSGREPQIRIFSTTGLPHCAKAVGMRNVTTQFRPNFWTPEAVAQRRARALAETGSGALNWRRDLHPLLVAEMRLQYYVQASLLRGGDAAAQVVKEELIRAWSEHRFSSAVARLESQLGRFDPDEHLSPHTERSFEGPQAYQDFVTQLVESDLAEAMRPGGSSPIKMAYEVLRFLRDPIRRAVEFGGLDAESHREFFPGVRGQINRLVAGPPAYRSQQLLALVEAGVVTMPYGPGPEVEFLAAGRAVVRSTHLDSPHQDRVDHLVRGFLEDPLPHRSASTLIGTLYRAGRLSRMALDGSAAEGVQLTRESHPVDAEGRVQERLWVFGALTEGARYFTNCIPSPGSRKWSFQEALSCALQVLSG